MEYLILPVKYIYISQGMYGNGSHKGKMALDFAAKDLENQKVYAPFTGIIKYKGTYEYGNAVWIESKEPVLFADGTIDYACVKIAHDNNINDLKVGQEIEQGEHFYNMGVAGNASGTHIHLELSKGKYKGYYSNLMYNPIQGFWITENTIIKSSSYEWKVLIGSPTELDVTKNQIEVLTTVLRARETPNGTIKGYIKKGIYTILETKKVGIYDWYRVQDNTWIAYSEDWAKLYKSTDIKTLQTEIINLKGMNDILSQRVKTLEELNNQQLIALDKVAKELATYQPIDNVYQKI